MTEAERVSFSRFIFTSRPAVCLSVAFFREERKKEKQRKREREIFCCLVRERVGETKMRNFLEVKHNFKCQKCLNIMNNTSTPGM